MKQPRVAIVADWIIGGGAERVVQELHKLYPDAPIYASYCSDEWRTRLDGKVVTGYLQHWPFSVLRKFAGLITPFRVRWYRNLDFSDYDTVITATGNGDAKHIQVPTGTKHICYCFTPVHYYWRHYQTYLDNPGFGPLNFLARLGLRLLAAPLRRADYAAAQKPEAFIAISKHIQDDIKTYYQRDSVIIAPPVNVKRFITAGRAAKNRSGFVTMGRLAPHKRTDLIVEACTKLGVPLTVIGRGPDYDNLVRRAGSNVSFKTDVTDAEMPEVLASHQAFLFASVEDFGIAPVEALASGTPVIALKAGGALDYVEEGVSGEFFEKATVDSLTEAIKDFDAAKFSVKKLQSKASEFSAQNFRDAMSKLITRLG